MNIDLLKIKEKNFVNEYFDDSIEQIFSRITLLTRI